MPVSNALRRTQWFRRAGWGVFFHYLADEASHAAPIDLSVDDWNRRVDAFDVNGLAAQLANLGVPYCCITIGQCSGFYLSPNETYDSIVGRRPSRCSRRDLVADLAAALSTHGIRLLAYLPAESPSYDPVAAERFPWRWGFKSRLHAFGGEPTGERLEEFQRMWEAVIHEWSERWSRAVHGWWIDGVYFADAMYRHAEPPNFTSLAAALRAGNPDSILAFNSGTFTPLIVQSDEDDFTAGECDLALPIGLWRDGERLIVDGRVEHAQLHVLSYLGRWWGQGSARLPDDLIVAYTRFLTQRLCVVSWDVPIRHSGLVADEFLRQLAAIRDGLA